MKEKKLEEMTIAELQAQSAELEKQHQALRAHRKTVNDAIAAKQEEVRRKLPPNPIPPAKIGV